MVSTHRRRWLRSSLRPQSRLVRPQIEILEGRLLLTTYTVTNTGDAGAGSLRQAILDANAHPGLNTIAFNLSGTGVQTVPLLSALPAITNPVLLDGTTQAGYAGSPLIVLSGANAGANVNGLTITAGNSTVKGLVINGFGGQGILLQGNGGDVIAGNYIGTDATGTARMANGGNGISVNASNNLIGGTTAADRNVISGNGGNGIAVVGTINNGIEGNYIGTNATGTAALGNNLNGITINNNGYGNRIGTNGDGIADNAERNIISGNGGSGIYLQNAQANRIAGNYIGTNALGSAALRNLQAGIYVNQGSQANVIGTTGFENDPAAARNVISGNGSDGVGLHDSTTQFNVVAGNYIGTDATGMRALGNSGNGVVFTNGAGHTRIGTNGDGIADAAERNVIAANGLSGISMRNALGNTVAGNSIGLAVDGSTALGNQSRGIFIGDGCQFNVIGTTGFDSDPLADRNIVAANRDVGIYLGGGTVSFNIIAGNYVGTDATGMLARGNVQDGIGVVGGAHDNRIGTNGDGIADVAERNVVSGNGYSGVVLDTAYNNTVAGNYLGTNALGTAAIPNGLHGVWVGTGAQFNVIGTNGTSVDNLAERNIISGNLANGVYLPSSNTKFNVVAGNYIGTDVTGTVALPNHSFGVQLYDSQQNRIGTNGDEATAAVERNVISGNLGSGIFFTSGITQSNVVAGNYIGTDASGLRLMANGGYAIALMNGAPNNRIGTTADDSAADGNVIAGGPLAGVFLNGARNTIIAGNDIGTDATGTALLGLMADGILLTAGASGNTIGGTGAAAGNVIGGNIFGIEMNTAGTTNNLVEGNAIGIGADGASPVPNVAHGVFIWNGAANNTIGGTDPGMGNTIAFNRGAGVVVAGAGGIGIRGNAIFGNAALGIDDGLLNYPVLTAAVSSDNGTTVTGTVAGDPLTILVLDFYTDSVCDPTGYGQAEAYLGTIEVATDADGNGAFTATFAETVPVGYFITATTTDPSNSTSDFAYCQEVVAGDGRQGLSVLPAALPVERVRMEGAQGGVIRPPFAGRGETWLNADQPLRRAVTSDGRKAPTSRRVQWAERIDAFWGDPVAGDLFGVSE